MTLFAFALRTFLASAILLISATNGCHSAQQSITKETIMSSLNESILSLLTLTDIEYSTLSDVEISNLEIKLAGLQRELVEKTEDDDESPPPGLWISAPTQISLGSINSFILMSFVYDGQRSWEVFPKNNMFLILRHRNSGQLWVGTPFLKPKRGRVHHSALGSGPKPLEAASWYTGVKRINLMDKFPTSLPIGSYTGTALYFDLSSNPAYFSMIDKEGDHPVSETETMPITTGVVINVPKEIALDAAKPLSLDAKLNVSSTEPWRGNVIALLVDEAPIIIPFNSEANITDLSITIDLQEKSTAWQTGHYQIYVDVGDHMAGPISMTITK